MTTAKLYFSLMDGYNIRAVAIDRTEETATKQSVVTVELERKTAYGQKHFLMNATDWDRLRNDPCGPFAEPATFFCTNHHCYHHQKPEFRREHNTTALRECPNCGQRIEHCTMPDKIGEASHFEFIN